MFAQLQAALNRVWDVVPTSKSGWRGWWLWLRKRILSMGMVLTMFILLASLVLSAAVEWVLPNAGDGAALLGRVAVFAISFVVAVLLFAALFKFLPDAEIPWHDVWMGACITALLFNAGKGVLSIYLQEGGVGENYGQATGGLIALLVWVYYSSVIVLLRAEATHSISRLRGGEIRPSAA